MRNPNAAFTILLGDFNVMSKGWWVYDITNNKGTQIKSTSSLYGFLCFQKTDIFTNSQLQSLNNIFSNKNHGGNL